MIYGLLVHGLYAEEKAEVPGVDELIYQSFAELEPPLTPEVPGGVKMAVTTRSEAAAQSVQDGMTCVHAGWDMEAYRHFVAALDEDPECLMAHWGVVVSQLHSSPEMTEVKEAAVARMMDLADRGVGTELEHRYVVALVQLLRDGPQTAARAFAEAREAFPNDPQLRVFEALLMRGGYDVSGEATPDQARAEELMRELVKQHPKLSYVRYALLAMRAEAGDLKSDLLMAQMLAADAPQFPPYQHLLGHYEWRTGNYGRARDAFARAAKLYDDWMQQTGLGVRDCVPWTRAKLYQATALASMGDYGQALDIAERVAAIEVTPEDALSKGGRALLWEAKTLPMRILMRRRGKGDAKLATKFLPSAEEVKGYGKATLAVWSFQVHSTVAGAWVALEEGDLDSAKKLSATLNELGQRFLQTRKVAATYGERSEWLRAFRAFEVMASELSGRITMAEPERFRGTAFNWYRSAADRQGQASMMRPPMVLLPMEYRLAEHFADRGENDKAIEALLDGLKAWPNDWELLGALKERFEAEGLDERVKEVTEKMEAIRIR